MGCRGRRLLLAILITLWGGRLAIYLIARKLREPGEDFRYAAMRKKQGARFPLWSLGMVF